MLVWCYSECVSTQASCSPEYITLTQQISRLFWTSYNINTKSPIKCMQGHNLKDLLENFLFSWRKQQFSISSLQKIGSQSWSLQPKAGDLIDCAVVKGKNTAFRNNFIKKYVVKFQVPHSLYQSWLPNLWTEQTSTGEKWGKTLGKILSFSPGFLGQGLILYRLQLCLHTDPCIVIYCVIHAQETGIHYRHLAKFWLVLLGSCTYLKPSTVEKIAKQG
jgi:hypothetical protein